jgi:hypothetical protein
LYAFESSNLLIFDRIGQARFGSTRERVRERCQEMKANVHFTGEEGEIMPNDPSIVGTQ